MIKVPGTNFGHTLGVDDKPLTPKSIDSPIVENRPANLCDKGHVHAQDSIKVKSQEQILVIQYELKMTNHSHQNLLMATYW